MPELPEVETVAAGLRQYWTGRTVAALTYHRPDLRFPLPADLTEQLPGQTVTAVERRAKYLIIRTDGGLHLLSHLGMTGAWLFEAEGYAARRTHDHILLCFTDGSASWYHDPRRFGFFLAFPDRQSLEMSSHLRHLGVEPLSNHWNGEALHRMFQRCHGPVKPALMQQQRVVGVGNIYASEALHRAGIHPACPASALSRDACERLAAAVAEVLREAIASGGSTLRDYTGLKGETGYFQHAFRVYDRAGEPCARQGCGGAIERQVQTGRATYFCATCQAL